MHSYKCQLVNDNRKSFLMTKEDIYSVKFTQTVFQLKIFKALTQFGIQYSAVIILNC